MKNAEPLIPSGDIKTLLMLRSAFPVTQMSFNVKILIYCIRVSKEHAMLLHDLIIERTGSRLHEIISYNCM